MFLFGIELQSSYIDRNRRIYAICTQTHTGRPGNNGRLLTTCNCVLTRVWRFSFGACAFMLKGTRFMPRTVPCTVTNALKKTCCSVNSENHTSPDIFVFKTCHLYLDTGNNIYLFRITFSSTQSIDIVLFFQYKKKYMNVRPTPKCFNERPTTMYYFILTFQFATLLSNLITELDPLIKN